jgi:hypothetical protein
MDNRYFKQVKVEKVKLVLPLSPIIPRAPTTGGVYNNT